jgi:hypothetical protein
MLPSIAAVAASLLLLVPSVVGQSTIAPGTAAEGPSNQGICTAAGVSSSLARYNVQPNEALNPSLAVFQTDRYTCSNGG